MSPTASPNERELLDDYVRTRAPDAFARLVESHIDFVYAAARRQVRDPHLADDVTQAVFIILSRKAHTIGTTAALSGWLFNTTRYCAANAVRAEVRHRRHERSAARPEVQMPTDITDASEEAGRLHAVLDDGLAALRRGDREIVLLRYLQGREVRDVGALLGISEETARKRLTRAVDRLRRHFARSGASATPSVIVAAMLAAHQSAPAHLLISTSGVASATAGSAAAAHLASQALRWMTWIKMKIAAAIFIAAATATVGSVAVVKTVLAQQTASPAPVAPQAPVTPAAPVPRFTYTFRDGLTVELIGIGENPSTGKPWWRPDGSPLDTAPYDHLGATSRAGKAQCAYEIAARVTHRPADDIDWAWEIVGSGGGASATAQSAANQEVPNIVAVAKSLPAGQPTNIRLRLATGPWQTRAVNGAKGASSSFHGQNGVSMSPVDAKGGAAMSVADTFIDEPLRIIAIATNGAIHRPTRVDTGGTEKFRLSVATFSRLTLAQVKEFQFQTRPFDRFVEFRNVSLKPGTATTVSILSIEPASVFKAQMPGGATVELLGVTNWPPAPNSKWWQPDGSPIDIPVRDYGTFDGPEPKADETAYAVATRWSEYPDDATRMWGFPNSHGVGVSNRTHGILFNDVEVFRVIVPRTDTTLSYRTGLAVGKHALTASTGPEGGGGDAHVTFSPAQFGNRDVTITVTYNIGDGPHRDLDFQLVVVDIEGVDHNAALMDQVLLPTRVTRTFRLGEIDAERVAQFRFESREYDTVEFRNVTLEPGKDRGAQIVRFPEIPPAK